MKELAIRLFTRIFPDGRLKNSLKCIYYNRLAKGKFKVSCKKNYFIILFKNTISFKCYALHEVFSDLAETLEGYLSKYSLKQGDSVIDCGAYVGAFALYAAKAIGPKGKVIAFEPDTINYKKLVKNIKLNNLNNVITINKGVWSKDTSLRFKNEHSVSSSFILDNTNEKTTSSVPVVSLDNELKRRGIKNINFIKMDVEGSEIEAIKGARKTLKNNDVNLAIGSYHIVNGKKTCFEVEKLFSRIGYNHKTSFLSHLTTYANKKGCPGDKNSKKK